MSNSRVALYRGPDRYDNLMQALALVADQNDLSGKERIVIKPNFVQTARQKAASQREAVSAVLAFLRDRGAQNMTIAEGPAAGRFEDGLDNYGYLSLVQEYGLRVVDLNLDDSVPVQCYGRDMEPINVGLARTLVESDFRVSVCLPKTHDRCKVTASVKNTAVASVTGTKQRIHPVIMHPRPDNSLIHINLCRISRYTLPHLAVIDGFQGMEGNGPGRGELVDWGIALASFDPVAADVVTADLMGFDPAQVGYLGYCGQQGMGQTDLEQIDIVGNTMRDAVRRSFRPHENYIETQLNWRVEGVERYLRL